MASPITVLSEEGIVEVPGQWSEGHPVIDADRLPTALGWELRPQGLCRGDVCVPIADRTVLERGAGIDLIAVANAIARPAVADPDEGVVVLGVPATERHRALDRAELPHVVLPDLDGEPHSLESWHGRKKLLVAFASW